MNAVFVFIFFFLLLFVSFLPLSLLVSYLATIVYSPLFHFASVQLNDFVPCLTCIIAYVAHAFCSLLFFPDISSCARGRYV